jgi:hypothetical protein
VPGLIKLPTLAWLKKIRIIFISKSGRDGDSINNLRPLSLLEICAKSRPGYSLKDWRESWN